MSLYPVRRHLVRRARGLVWLLAPMLCSAAIASAQRRGGFNQQMQEPPVNNVPYDGRFTFARLKFTTGPGGFYYMGLPAWAHGYMKAEDNLVRILGAVGTIKARIDVSNVLALDDPELCKYPVAYMAEADYWTMTDKEATALRAYILKGGFIIFDDFRDDFRNGGAGWANFDTQMKRLIPNARFLDLDPSFPIFHSFFEINTFDIIPQMYDRGHPVLRGLFVDNDPTKRMIAMVNFNTDVSDFWEFSATGFRPIQEGNEAYKLGVNYVVYSLTH